jgi:hypothetical protein
MTPYAWRCSVCDGSNPAGSNACVVCGHPARSSGTAILKAREHLASSKESVGKLVASAKSPSSTPHLEVRGVLAVLGVLLFAIGLASLAHGHWPGFLPPQLDALEAVASFIAQRLGVPPNIPAWLVAWHGAAYCCSAASYTAR